MGEQYQLFHYDGCGFCYRVRRFLADNEMDVPLRNIHAEPDALTELVQGGGRRTVPCLRIERGNEVFWMYESMDIINYLRQQRSER